MAKSKFKFALWDDFPSFHTDRSPHSRPMYLYLHAKREYYKGDPIMSDETFDSFEADIKKIFPDCPALKVVGEPQSQDYKDLMNWCCDKREECKGA